MSTDAQPTRSGWPFPARCPARDLGDGPLEELGAARDVGAVVFPVVLVLDREQRGTDPEPVDLPQHLRDLTLAGAPGDVVALGPELVEVLDVQRQQA